MSARSSSSRPWQGACAAAPVLGNSALSWPSSSASASSSSRPSSCASASSSSRPSSCASAAAQGSDEACNLDAGPGLIPAKLAYLFPYITPRVNCSWVVTFFLGRDVGLPVDLPVDSCGLAFVRAEFSSAFIMFFCLIVV